MTSNHSEHHVNLLNNAGQVLGVHLHAMHRMLLLRRLPALLMKTLHSPALQEAAPITTRFSMLEVHTVVLKVHGIVQAEFGLAPKDQRQSLQHYELMLCQTHACRKLSQRHAPSLSAM